MRRGPMTTALTKSLTRCSGSSQMKALGRVRVQYLRMFVDIADRVSQIQSPHPRLLASLKWITARNGSEQWRRVWQSWKVASKQSRTVSRGWSVCLRPQWRYSTCRLRRDVVVALDELAVPIGLLPLLVVRRIELSPPLALCKTDERRLRPQCVYWGDHGCKTLTNNGPLTSGTSASASPNYETTGNACRVTTATTRSSACTPLPQHGYVTHNPKDRKTAAEKKTDRADTRENTVSMFHILLSQLQN